MMHAILPLRLRLPPLLGRWRLPEIYGRSVLLTAISAASSALVLYALHRAFR